MVDSWGAGLGTSKALITDHFVSAVEVQPSGLTVSVNEWAGGIVQANTRIGGARWRP